MRIALLLLLLTGFRDERAERFFDQMKIDPPNLSDDMERRVVVALLQKEYWVGAYTELANRFGPFADDLDVSVDFKHPGPEAAVTRCRKKERKVSFNLKMMVDLQKQHDELARMKRDGKNVELKVPPMKMDRLIVHEVTHVLQGACDAPQWFIEGMAQLAADDLNAIGKFIHDGKKVLPLDVAISDLNEIYARGHLFWRWLDARGAMPKTVELVFGQRVPWKQALEEAAGRSWTSIVADERDWSLQEIRRLK